MKYQITYCHHGYGELFIDNRPQTVLYAEGTDLHIPCCNRHCNGEYNMRRLDFSKPHDFLMCHGTMGSPKRQRVYRKCANMLECWITALPDEDTQQS